MPLVLMVINELPVVLPAAREPLKESRGLDEVTETLVKFADSDLVAPKCSVSKPPIISKKNNECLLGEYFIQQAH